jgi:hypothetical protein
MIPALRAAFNKDFTETKYQDFLTELNGVHPGAIEFRVAETPVFVPKDFTAKIMDACESIVDLIIDPKFKELTRNAIPAHLQVPGQNDHSHFIAFDFGVCLNKDGQYEPQLIEMQGFPSLFAYEVLLDDITRKYFPVPANFEAYLGEFDRDSYIQELKAIIIKDQPPESVVLLEISPEKQKTRIDFHATEDYLGIKILCLTKLIKEGNKLFYEEDGKKIRITRIYNRVIFDELQQQPDAVQQKGKILFEQLDVEWVPHPNWFYRISKYTMPFIRHPFVPPTYFLNELTEVPNDLENYVLKPLFSFAGQGVVIDVTQKDIDSVEDPKNWILQRKVKYADAIITPDEPAKCEIRIFYFWKDGASRPLPANNLARLSKGKMIGVRYNKDKEWVGGSYCLFEK